MKIFLCGEGVHEIGRAHFWDDRAQCYRSVDGWMQVLARRLCARAGAAELVGRLGTRIDLLPPDQKKYKPLPTGHGRRALAAKLAAKREGCDVVVYMLDADTCDHLQWRRKKNEVIEGFSTVDNGVVGLACIPMSTSEAWFLADAGAWSVVAPGSEPNLPADPEMLWGQRDDVRGNHPKNRFARVCSDANVDDCLDTRTLIASAMDILEVARRCPKSFGEFLMDTKSIGNALGCSVD